MPNMSYENHGYQTRADPNQNWAPGGEGFDAPQRSSGFLDPQPAAMGQPGNAAPGPLFGRPDGLTPVSRMPENNPGLPPPAPVPFSRPPEGMPVGQPSAGFPVSQPSAGFPVSQPSAGYPMSQPSAGFPLSQPSAGYVEPAFAPQPGAPGAYPEPDPFPGQQQWENAPVQPQQPPRDSTMASLTDFSFSKYATPGLVKVLYIVASVVAVLYVLGIVISMFASGVQMGGVGIVLAIVGLVGGLVGLAAFVLLLRVWLEMSLAIITMAGDLGEIRAHYDNQAPTD